MVEYVEKENPQYFNYRYGYKDGEAFIHSFRQFRDLLKWTLDNDYQVEAEARTPTTLPGTLAQAALGMQSTIPSSASSPTAVAHAGAGGVCYCFLALCL